MFYSYKPGVGSSRLARELKAVVAYPTLGKQTGRRRKVYTPAINWGLSARLSRPMETEGVLNADISKAQSKVLAFTDLEALGLPVPRWSKDYDTLRQRIGGERLILARRDGLSHGAGMSLVDSGASSSGLHADFFVERLSYHREFRVHVFQGSVIHSQVKVKSGEAPDGVLARNFENGWLYTSQNIERYVPVATLKQAQDLAVSCMAQLGLDFGAVDLLQNKKGKIFFLEVNSAPALRSDATFGAYLKAIKELWKIK